MKIFKSFSENEYEKVDFRKEARNLFNKLAKVETAILIIFGEEILERFYLVNKEIQNPGLDTCESNKLIISLKEFVNNKRQQSDQKLKEYEEKAKKLSTSVGTDYSDINMRCITSKFSNKSIDKVSVHGAEKFKKHDKRYVG